MASLRAHIGAWMVRRRVKAPLAAAGGVEDVRRILGGATFPDPKDATFEPGSLGGIPGEWVRPVSGNAPHRLLYVHGGGFVACSPKTHRPVTGAFARRGFTVFAPDYRLAPEHPFPAGLNDVVAAWTAFRAAGPACLAGESAGGDLALALMLAARDKGVPLPVAACLFSPVTDLTTVDGSRVSNGWRDAMFTSRSIPDVAPLYVGGGDPRVPLASPVYGDPTGLPPLRPLTPATAVPTAGTRPAWGCATGTCCGRSDGANTISVPQTGRIFHALLCGLSHYEASQTGSRDMVPL